MQENKKVFKNLSKAVKLFYHKLTGARVISIEGVA